LKIITASDGVNFIKSNGELNSHVWMSPDNAAKEVKNIANALSEFDPANAAIYEKNSETFSSKTALLKSSITEKLKSISNRNIITFHAAFNYLAHDFNLNVVSLIENDPDNAPSPAMIAGIIDLGKRDGVTALFTEAQYPSTIPEIISSEIGANTYELDPIVTPDNSGSYTNVPIDDEYFVRMEKNADILKIALGG
jgi:zinc transport system substrate-binding protein